MAGIPRLNINGLPGASPEEAEATSSPARGKEMRANLLSKLRAPPLVHAWDFWHDRQDRNKDSNTNKPAPSQAESFPNESAISAEARESLDTESHKYEERLVHLAAVTDVRAFWNLFNNFDVSTLPLRDSVHLFHRGVKPVWEDARNSRGGSWTFRVPREKAQEFWKEICMLAIGERLQGAVASQRKTFVDDICGVSLSVRFTSILVQIWNRDAEHEEGINKLLATVMNNTSAELKPKEGSYYYKAHKAHSGFSTGATPRGDFAADPTMSAMSSASPSSTSALHQRRGDVGISDQGSEIPRPVSASSAPKQTESTSNSGTTELSSSVSTATGSSMSPMSELQTDRERREMSRSIGPPGEKMGDLQSGGYQGHGDRVVPKELGSATENEVIEEIDKDLKDMKEAMDHVAEKDRHIQEHPGQRVDERMVDE